MTVEELRKKLERLEPKTEVVVYRETDDGTEFFGISDVSLHRGTPRRDEQTHKAGFTFANDGPSVWLFISIDED